MSIYRDADNMQISVSQKEIGTNKPKQSANKEKPTIYRKRVGYLQISYQYHLSPTFHPGSLHGPVDHGQHKCCHGMSCKMKADYTRSMCLSYGILLHNYNSLAYEQKYMTIETKSLTKYSHIQKMYEYKCYYGILLFMWRKDITLKTM